MPYDGGPLYIKAEAYLNGAWVEITSRALGGRAASGVEIKQGRSDGALRGETSRLEMALGNADGYLTEGNPGSPYWPYFRRGCEIRVSLADILGSDAQRFSGRIDTIEADYPGGSFTSVRITALGTLGSRGQGTDPQRSAMERAILADGPAGFWRLDDPVGSTSGSSGLGNGAPMATPGGVTWAAQAAPAGGSLPLAQVGNVTLSGPLSINPTTAWSFEVVAYVDEPASDGLIVGINTDAVSPGATFQLYTQTTTLPLQLAVNGGSALSAAGRFSGFDEAWHHYLINVELSGANVNGEVWYDGVLIASGNIWGGATALPHPRTLQVNPVLGTVRLATMAAGFAAAYDHANVDAVARYQAMLGWAGEMAHERIQRLCEEEGIAVSITGSTSPLMGPQGVDTLTNLLTDAEYTGQGLLHDGGTDGAVVYVCASALYNQSAALTIASGTIMPDLRPTWDYQAVRNDVTSSLDGASERATDEAHIADYGRVRDSRNPNVQAAGQLGDDAGWALNVGTAAGPRYAGIGLNLRNSVGRNYADQVLALAMGDRFAVAAGALPSQHPPGGIDALVIGWTEHLDAVEWTLRPHCVPYSPYLVAELDDDDSGKLDTDGSDLTAAVNSSATSLSVATQTGTSPLWTTSGGEMPIPLLVAGEVMSATAIAAPTTVTYGAVGTAAHASNASVTPGIPASVATGNLLLCLAAIRNSGTGVPDTPAGYTRLPAFAVGDNVQVFGKVATSSGEVAPTITFTGGVANATTSAQMIRIAGAFSDPAEAFVIGNNQLNASAQNIGYPCLALTEPQLDTTINNCIVIYIGWKQDDWTSVATLAGATEIAEASTTTGDDQALVWDYVIQTTATDIAAGGSFIVTGGASAISRGATFAIRSNIQAVTVTRSVNGVSKSHTAGTAVNVYRPARPAL